MKSLAILGAGGHGKVVAEAAELSGWRSIIFFDDKFPNQKEISKWQIKGDSDDFVERAEQFDGIHVAIGNNVTRRKKLEEFAPKKFGFYNSPFINYFRVSQNWCWCIYICRCFNQF